MDFLSELNISENTINILNNKLSEIEKNEIDMCIEEIISSVEYLRKIGINDKTIEDIFLEDYQILNLGKENLEKALSKINLNSFVHSINNDSKYMIYLKDFI